MNSVFGISPRFLITVNEGSAAILVIRQRRFTFLRMAKVIESTRPHLGFLIDHLRCREFALCVRHRSIVAQCRVPCDIQEQSEIRPNIPLIFSMTVCRDNNGTHRDYIRLDGNRASSNARPKGIYVASSYGLCDYITGMFLGISMAKVTRLD